MQKDIINHIVRWVLAGTVMLVLSGCMPQYQMTTDLFLRCHCQVNNALKNKQSVTIVYSVLIVDTGCQTAAHDRATIDYQAYQQQFGSEHPSSMKTVDDFYDDSQCQLAKRCTPVYQQCFVNCGGTAEQKKICVKNCPDGTTSSSSKPMSD